MNTLLTEILFQEIAAQAAGSLSFARFMELALYHPRHGYYANPETIRTGREGDFFTSVSVGDCFGLLLGYAIEARWRDVFSSPDRFTIVEQGAHDGQLAVDIVAGLARRRSPAMSAIRYRVIEPLPLRREFLEKRFAELAPPVPIEVVAAAGEIREADGIFLANELLDAFPVHRLIRRRGQWREHRVRRAPGAPSAEVARPFDWTAVPISPGSELFQESRRLPESLPEGYATEVCSALDPWVREVAPMFERGLWWIFDYGLTAEQYWSPGRTDGALRAYRGHQLVEDPLERPGETDLTAHVNFSRLTESAAETGLARTELEDQHRFLTRTALPWLREIESSGISQTPGIRKRLRQFQTLTHPELMGRSFQFVEFSNFGEDRPG